jgi:hypothetical protein
VFLCFSPFPLLLLLQRVQSNDEGDEQRAEVVGVVHRLTGIVQQLCREKAEASVIIRTMMGEVQQLSGQNEALNQDKAALAGTVQELTGQKVAQEQRVEDMTQVGGELEQKSTV